MWRDNMLIDLIALQIGSLISVCGFVFCFSIHSFEAPVNRFALQCNEWQTQSHTTYLCHFAGAHSFKVTELIAYLRIIFELTTLYFQFHFFTLSIWCSRNQTDLTRFSESDFNLHNASNFLINNTQNLTFFSHHCMARFAVITPFVTEWTKKIDENTTKSADIFLLPT